MPIYEYRCETCGHTFEVFQKFIDEPVTSCESCGGPVNKVFHPVAIHFKGSGFYTTDYGRSSSFRGASAAEASGSDSGSSESGSGGGSSEGESKAAAKSADAGAGNGAASSRESAKRTSTSEQ